jgi:hypothetical protein
LLNALAFVQFANKNGDKKIKKILLGMEPQAD